MQLQQNIIQTFAKRGYGRTSSISKREFHILMNNLIAQTSNPHRLFNQNLTNQIWKQTQDRVQKDGKTPRISTGNLKQPGRIDKIIQLSTVDIIRTMVDAIQILTNRLLQCEEVLRQLIQKRKKIQEQMKFAKIQQNQTKIIVIKKDLQQFNQDFKMLTQPFLRQKSKDDLKKQSSLNKGKASFDKINSIQKYNTQMGASYEFQVVENQLKKKYKPKQSNSQSDKTSVYEQKRCALYFLIFLMVLEVTVSLWKFNFVNLLVFLIGFLVLMQQRFMPSMLKIGFYSCLFSIVLDGLWLYFYSSSYLQSHKNSGLKHELKPYFQYIWFITTLQVFLKTIYAYFIRQYQTKSIRLIEIQKQQKQKQLQNKQIKDNYIPQIRQLATDMVKQQQRDSIKRKEQNNLQLRTQQNQDLHQ